MDSNKDAKYIAKYLNVRTKQQNFENEAYITVKDHKSNFPIKIKRENK